MSYLFALLSRSNEDVTPILLSTLKKIPSPCNKTIQISLSNGVTKYKKIPEKLEHGAIALATTEEFHIDNTVILNNIKKQYLFNNYEISSLVNINVPYSFVKIGSESLIIARDPVGTIPLYMGENQKLYAISTHKKYLWAMGLDINLVIPGILIEISPKMVKQKQIRTISQLPQKNESITTNVNNLDKILQKIVKLMIPKNGKVSLGFSGGIDSTILAYYLKKEDADISLVCVGLDNSSEFEAAERAAQTLDLPLNTYKYSASAVENDLERVLWIIEDHNPVNVGIGIPLLWAVIRARELENEVFFSGSGADELFGGYYKYQGKPSQIAQSMIFNDVVNSYKLNYERDYMVCQSLGLNLMMPYADIQIIEYGLSLPMSQKLPDNPSEPRKIVLRSLAKNLGIPEDVTSKQKKAFQYSTGVNKELLKLAKKNRMKLNLYLKTRFDKMKKVRLFEGTDNS